MINDKVKTTGELHIVLRGPDGKIKDDRTVPNLVVTVGKGVIASRLTGNTTAVMSHMAVGTSAVAPVAADTALGAEIAASRTALVTPGGVAAANVVTHTCTFGPGVGTGAIVEAGIFNNATPGSGSMLAHTTFAVVNKDVGDSLTIEWAVTIS